MPFANPAFFENIQNFLISANKTSSFHEFSELLNSDIQKFIQADFLFIIKRDAFSLKSEYVYNSAIDSFEFLESDFIKSLDAKQETIFSLTPSAVSHEFACMNSMIYSPILSGQRLIGYLIAFNNSSPHTNEEFKIINFIATLISPIFEKLILLEEKNFISKELEDRYIERAELMNEVNERMNESLETKIQIQSNFNSNKSVLKSIINNMDFYIWAIDSNYNLLFINDLYKRTIFRNKNIDVKEGENILNYLPISEFEHYKEFFQKAFNGEKITFEETRESNDIKKNLRISYLPITLNDTSEIIGLVCFAKDITDEKNMFEEMSSELRKERNFNKYQNKYISMISHEYKTPLTTIATSTYILERLLSSNTDAKVEKQIKSINKAVDKINNLLNQALTLSKVETNKMCFIQKETNIKEHFEGILYGFEDEDKERIKFEYIGDTNKIIFAGVALTIITDNLLSNALKFSPYDGVVNLSVEKNESEIIIIVSDNGAGITNEDVQFIYEPFYRGENTVGIEGVGLGLSIVREITESFGGKIEVTSQAGYGSEFKIVLPIVND